MINGLSALFLFSNNCFYQASIIDGLYTSYTLYALYVSILMVLLYGGTLFNVNFNIVYQYMHYGSDNVSLFDDTSLFSIVFNTVIMAGFITIITNYATVQYHLIIDIFKSIPVIDKKIIRTTRITFQALPYVVELPVSLF